MTSFDYLRSRRAFLARILAYRPSSALRAPASAVVCAAFVVSSLWMLEARRLAYAEEREQALTAAYRAQLPALRNADTYASQVKSLMALDRSIRSIVASSTSTARRFAAIAKDLPANVWLTGVTPDPAGLLLEGRTSSYTALADGLRRLNRDALVGQSRFSAAQTVEKAKPALALRFVVHVSL